MRYAKMSLISEMRLPQSRMQMPHHYLAFMDNRIP
jgi:hypothetical protein